MFLGRAGAPASPGQPLGGDAFDLGFLAFGGVDVECRGVFVFLEVRPAPLGAEGLVGQDVGTDLVAQAHGPAEMVEVRVGDDHGVDIGHAVAGAAEPVVQVLP